VSNQTEWRWADPTGQQRLVREDELRAAIASGVIPANAPVWTRGWSGWKPARWLAGFAPVAAQPGETVTVRIPLPPRTWQVWDEGWHTVPGTYAVTAAHALDDPRLTATLAL